MISFYDIVLCPLERIGNDIIVGNQDFILNYFVDLKYRGSQRLSDERALMHYAGRLIRVTC